MSVEERGAQSFSLRVIDSEIDLAVAVREPKNLSALAVIRKELQKGCGANAAM
jgi:hypothetical protein